MRIKSWGLLQPLSLLSSKTFGFTEALSNRQTWLIHIENTPIQIPGPSGHKIFLSTPIYLIHLFKSY